eukprot:gene1057-2633_t
MIWELAPEVVRSLTSSQYVLGPQVAVKELVENSLDAGVAPHD